MVVMMGGGTGGEDDIICSLINFDYQWLNNTGNINDCIVYSMCNYFEQ